MENEKKKPLNPGARFIKLLKKHDWNTAVRILQKELKSDRSTNVKRV